MLFIGQAAPQQFERSSMRASSSTTSSLIRLYTLQMPPSTPFVAAMLLRNI
jgi:hypothetical protein